MTNKDLAYAIKEYGTPLYIFNSDEMRATAARFRKSLAGLADLCFAIKANPFMIETMASAVDRIEVCSTGEFHICKMRQIPPEKLLISGVLKKEEDLKIIMDTYGGTCRYTAESSQQFHLLADLAAKRKEKIRVFLRLTDGCQFGMDETVLEDLIAHREDFSYVTIIGIHYFTGTQKKSLRKIEKELTFLDNYIDTLKEQTGYVPEELEYGPGLAVPYFENQPDKREEELAGLSEIIRGMRFAGKITLEMGRALAAEGGYYLTTVRDIKQNKGRNYCIVDGGIHHINYDGQIRGMYPPVTRLLPITDAPEEEWTVCGALCTTNDILIQKMNAKGLAIGSVIVFERTGAYAFYEGMSTFLSHPLPAITMCSEADGWKLLREKKETYLFNTKEI